jgi:hypothetical protein
VEHSSCYAAQFYDLIVIVVRQSLIFQMPETRAVEIIFQFINLFGDPAFIAKRNDNWRLSATLVQAIEQLLAKEVWYPFCLLTNFVVALYLISF